MLPADVQNNALCLFTIMIINWSVLVLPGVAMYCQQCGGNAIASGHHQHGAAAAVAQPHIIVGRAKSVTHTLLQRRNMITISKAASHRHQIVIKPPIQAKA
jgi:hypothetical protein